MRKKIVSYIAASFIPISISFGMMNIEMSLVGDAGNPADPATGYGRVDYDYYIGKYEVTNAEYAEFLNDVAVLDIIGLYSSSMGSGGISRSGSNGSYSYTATDPNKPAGHINFWRAARFVNWLTTGDTESGVYVLTPTGISNNTITRNATAWANGGYAIASVNEWYKAAYYSGSPTGADGDGYWYYPVQSNGITTADANFDNIVGELTDVGTYSHAPSHYGTYDQAANAWEWCDDIIGEYSRARRSSSYKQLIDDLMLSLYQGDYNPSPAGNDYGFRITRLAATPNPPVPVSAVIVKAVGVRFNSVFGQTYQVQYKLNLEDESWTNVGTTIQGDDTTKTFYDDINNTSGFYRVVEL